ncbi:MAG: NAD(P)/FAD-dependent oxidoreductase [Actinomycetota bacterium]|nr:NAD(P)/FAD-dependent oxidoreductase [Actinomycetota bacterium]
MTDTFDVIVLGAGPPGENAAGRAADGGLSVAIIEERLVGGECSYYGCIPSKTMIRPGDILAAARRVPGAVQAVTGSIDVAAALAQRDYMTSNWDDSGAVPWLDGKGITLIRGTALFAGEKTVEVEVPGSAPRRVTANKAVVVACGTRPLVPPIDGIADVGAWDNRDATSAKEVPRRLLVLGGGAIGAEMAQCFKRLGTDEVTVVEGGPRLLAREEPFAGEELRTAFEAEGITVITGARMSAVSREGPVGPVTATLADGRTISADEILVAVGRTPNTDRIGLETIGLSGVAGKYLPVDKKLRVDGRDWLYAVGDIAGLALLTHMGKYQGRLVGDILAGKDVEDIADHVAIPRVTFTDPQVAAVGMTEADAHDKGIHTRTVSYQVGDVPGAYTQGNNIRGTGQIVVDEARRVIVGATFTGPGVQEIVHAATIAIVGEVPLDTLWHAVPSFPTVSEVWLHLLEEYGL